MEENRDLMTPEQYKEEYNEMLRQKGLRVVDSRFEAFLRLFFLFGLISILIFAGLFIYYIKEGKFQTNISQPILNDLNNTVNNNYEFNPSNSVNNEYKIVFNATIIIPTNVTVNIVNQSI